MRPTGQPDDPAPAEQGTDQVEAAVAGHLDYVSGETLAVELSIGSLPDSPAESQALTVNGQAANIALRKADWA